MSWIREMDEKAALDFKARAKGYLDNARDLDPSRYPTDIGWRQHFVREARTLWRSYLFHRKEAQQ